MANHLVDIGAIALLLVSFILVGWHYRNDDDVSTYEGKAHPIEGGRLARLHVKGSFYAAAVLTACSLLIPDAMNGPVPRSTALTATGACVALLGLLLFVKAKAVLGRAYSPCYKSFVPTSLVTSGPYAEVRHPLYAANLLLMTGAALVSASLLVFLILLSMGARYLRSIRREESALASAMPGYGEYVQRTGALMPRSLSSLARLVRSLAH